MRCNVPKLNPNPCKATLVGNKSLSLLLTSFSWNPFSQIACMVQLAGKLNITPCQHPSAWLWGLWVLWGLNFSPNWVWQPSGTCLVHSSPNCPRGPMPVKGLLCSNRADLPLCSPQGQPQRVTVGLPVSPPLACPREDGTIQANWDRSGVSHLSSEMTPVEVCVMWDAWQQMSCLPTPVCWRVNTYPTPVCWRVNAYPLSSDFCSRCRRPLHKLRCWFTRGKR